MQLKCLMFYTINISNSFFSILRSVATLCHIRIFIYLSDFHLYSRLLLVAISSIASRTSMPLRYRYQSDTTEIFSLVREAFIVLPRD